MKAKKMNKETLLDACVEACRKLNKDSSFAFYICGCLYANGILDDILFDTVDLLECTDKELEQIDGIGTESIRVLRLARIICDDNTCTQMEIDFDESTANTGSDIIKWIRMHNLTDKEVYYTGHNCIGFKIDSDIYEGMEYYTCGDLNVINGEFKIFKDAVS